MATAFWVAENVFTTSRDVNLVWSFSCFKQMIELYKSFIPKHTLAIIEDEVFLLFLHYEVTSFGLEFCKQTCLLFSVLTVGHTHKQYIDTCCTHTHIGKYWQQTKVSSPRGCCWSKVGCSIFIDIKLIFDTFLSSCFDLTTSLSTCCVSAHCDAIDSASLD